jgi:hypothetical protein
MFDIRRRAFITLLGGAAVTWRFAARVLQPQKVARIGFLGLDVPPTLLARADEVIE